MIETDFVAFHSQLRRFRTTRGRAGGRRASGCSTLSLGLRLAFRTPGLEPAAPWAAAAGLTAPLTVRPGWTSRLLLRNRPRAPMGKTLRTQGQIRIL